MDLVLLYFVFGGHGLAFTGKFAILLLCDLKHLYRIHTFCGIFVADFDGLLELSLGNEVNILKRFVLNENIWASNAMYFLKLVTYPQESISG